MVIQTDRLLLRPWREEEAEILYEYASDPAVGPSAGWLPHTDVEYSCGILRTILMKPTVFAVCSRDDRPIGNIHLDFHSALCEREGECELGFWLGKPFWGQGIMTEAARALLRFAFEECEVHGVWSGYYDGNERSRRVQEKLGFSYVQTDMVTDIDNQSRPVHRTRLKKEDYQKYKGNNAVLPELYFNEVCIGETSCSN